MPRLSTNVAAAFAAIIITIVSLQTITSVPPTQLAVIDAPKLA
ncbi:hypothetical protein [Erythrobacter sp. SD-21]|nr:hypothetical protein [Erythrobacter sp. SD-21]EDL49153.1 hypothetical protein ED21_20774 [Erythrobacter sp. SD-21]